MPINTDNVVDTKVKVKADISRIIRVEEANLEEEVNHIKTREVVSTSKSQIRDLEVR